MTEEEILNKIASREIIGSGANQLVGPWYINAAALAKLLADLLAKD